MGRKYTRESYLELVSKIKAAIPNIALTTDIIVGYPNETEDQFEETLTLYDEVAFEHAYTYLYSQRDGTPAAKMKDNVPLEVKTTITTFKSKGWTVFTTSYEPL